MTRAQVVEKSTALATLDDYERAGGFNVLHPVVHLGAAAAIVVSEDLTESISEIRIVPGVDTYHDFRFANERDGKFALGGLGLGKLASAAGMRWLESGVVEARDRDRETGHVYIRVRATGAVLQPNGEPYLISVHKEIDTADLAEQYANDIRKKAVREKKTITDAEVDAQVRERILQVREHILSLAETKAQNRVIRKVLSLKQVYTKQELQRPFAVPRLLVRPDLNDPVMRASAQLEGRQAAEQVYGPPHEGQPAMGALPSGASVAAGGLETDPTDATTADATATGSVSPGGEAPATGRGRGTSRSQTAKGKGGSAKTDPAPSATTEIPEPSGDPRFTGGPHKGERMSEVVDSDADYLRGIVSGKVTPVTVNVKKLAQEWLDWTHPSLGVDDP